MSAKIYHFKIDIGTNSIHTESLNLIQGDTPTVHITLTENGVPVALAGWLSTMTAIHSTASWSNSGDIDFALGVITHELPAEYLAVAGAYDVDIRIQNPVGPVVHTVHKAIWTVEATPGVLGPEEGTNALGVNVQLTQRLDNADDGYTYLGDGPVGSLEIDPYWRIRRMEEFPDGDIVVLYADGDAKFDNIWNDRLTLMYS